MSGHYPPSRSHRSIGICVRIAAGSRGKRMFFPQSRIPFTPHRRKQSQKKVHCKTKNRASRRRRFSKTSASTSMARRPPWSVICMLRDYSQSTAPASVFPWVGGGSLMLSSGSPIAPETRGPVVAWLLANSRERLSAWVDAGLSTWVLNGKWAHPVSCPH